MPRAILFLDVSRLVRRYEHFGGPTGIDRIEWRYATWLLEQDAFVPRPVTGAGRGLVELRESAFRHLLATLERRWSAAAPPQFGRGGRSAVRWSAERALQRTRRIALLRGARTPDAAGAANVTLNVGHDGLEEPARFAQLPGPFAALLSDLIPLTHPEYDTPRATMLHARRIETLARRADHVVTISHATRQALLDQVSEPRFTTSVAHLGPGLSAPDRAAVFDRPTFVHLSSIDRRKNLALLLHVWREMAGEPDPPALLVIGRRGNDATAMEMLDRCTRIRPHVTATGGLGDSAVAERLGGAQALLSPSFVEGFGLPIAEAQAIGVPAIASDIPAHREIGGHATRFVHPLDGPGWKAAIRSLASDDGAREALAGSITPPATWADHFNAVAETLDVVARRR